MQSDAERELSAKYPPGTTVTYMDPRDDARLPVEGSEELLLASGTVNGECIIADVRRQTLDAEGNVTGTEPYELGYVPVWNGKDSVYVAVPNIVEFKVPDGH